MVTLRHCDACCAVEKPEDLTWLRCEGRSGAITVLGDPLGAAALDLCPRCGFVLRHLVKFAQDNGLDMKGAVVEEGVTAR